VWAVSWPNGRLQKAGPTTAAAKKASAAGDEEGLEKCRGFIGEDTGDDFDAMIEARMRENFETGADCAATRVVGTVNEFRNAGLDHGAGTHRTGLECDVDRRTGKAVVVKNMGCFAENDNFGMGGGVIVANRTIAGACDDFVIVDEKCADGHLSGGGGGAGFVESELHEIEIGGHAKKE